MKKTFVFFSVYFFCFTLFGENKNFVVVIPSYNNVQYYKRNLDSILCQNYENFRVIYIDDCSSDGTGDLVEDYLRHHPRGSKVKLIRNRKRHLKMFNLYHAVHSCDDLEIIAELDGDDWYRDENVLHRLNDVYQENVWLTYGNIQKWPPQPVTNTVKPIPSAVVKRNAFRKCRWRHLNIQVQLRTFYAGLFKKLSLNDLFFNGKFVPMSADIAIMLPMYEMASERFKFISEPFYVHNVETSLNDHKVNSRLQAAIDNFIRSKAPYHRIDDFRSEENRVKVGLIILINDADQLHRVLESIGPYMSDFSLIVGCKSIKNFKSDSGIDIVYKPFVRRYFSNCDYLYFTHDVLSLEDMKNIFSKARELERCKADIYDFSLNKAAVRLMKRPYERVGNHKIYATSFVSTNIYSSRRICSCNWLKCKNRYAAVLFDA